MLIRPSINAIKIRSVVATYIDAFSYDGVQVIVLRLIRFLQHLRSHGLDAYMGMYDQLSNITQASG